MYFNDLYLIFMIGFSVLVFIITILNFIIKKSNALDILQSLSIGILLLIQSTIINKLWMKYTIIILGVLILGIALRKIIVIIRNRKLKSTIIKNS